MLEVGVVLEDKAVVGGKRKRVSKTPIPGEDGTPLRGVEVDEQVGPFIDGFPIRSVPAHEQMG